MKIEGKLLIKAPIQDVRDFLLDPQKLAPCVPGCENVVTLADNSYMVTEAVKIGPISASFNLKVTIVEMTPPRCLFITLEGKDFKTASLINTKTTINLERISDSETQVNYVLDVALSGVLGKFGEGIMRRKAHSLAEKFTENLRAQLEVRRGTT